MARFSSTPLFDTDKESPLVNYKKAFVGIGETLSLTRCPRKAPEAQAVMLKNLRREQRWAIGQAPANRGPVPGPSRRNASQGPRDESNRRYEPSGRKGDRRNTSQDNYRSSGRSREQSRARSPSRERRRSESQESVDSHGNPKPGPSSKRDRDRHQDKYRKRNRSESPDRSRKRSYRH